MALRQTGETSRAPTVSRAARSESRCPFRVARCPFRVRAGGLCGRQAIQARLHSPAQPPIGSRRARSFQRKLPLMRDEGKDTVLALQHEIARRGHVFIPAHHQHQIHRRGEIERLDGATRRLRIRRDGELHQPQPRAREGEQGNERVMRNLGLDHMQDGRGRADQHIDPQVAEELLVVGIVDARDGEGNLIARLGDLADHQIVVVVARHRDHQIRALSADLIHRARLAGVTTKHRGSQILLQAFEAHRILLQQQHLMSLLDQTLRQVIADLAAASNDDIHVVPV